jgi:hypothetical protein
MNCSRKTNVRRDANLRGARPNRRHQTDAAMPALNEFSVGRWLAIAGVFLLLAPRTFASVSITGGQGELNAHTVICTDPGHCNIVLPDCDRSDAKFIAAPIGSQQDPPADTAHVPRCSATDQNGNAVFAGPVDVHGEYIGDAQSMTMTVTASGSANADASSGTAANAESGSTIEFTVTGEPTDVPISVSMTALNCSFVSAKITGPGNFSGEITADNDGQHGSFPPGPLSPGNYTIDLTFQADSPFPPTNYNFNFSATIVVHTTAPIEWINPVDGSFQAVENWSPQKVPSGTDDAVFDVPGTYTVSLDGNASHNALFGSGNGVNVTFLLGGNTYALNQLQLGGLADESVSFTFSGADSPASRASRSGGFAPQASGGLVPVTDPIFIKEGMHIVSSKQSRLSAPFFTVEGSLMVKDPSSLLTADILSVGFSGSAPELIIDEGQVVSTNALIAGSAFVAVGRSFLLQTPDPSHWEIADELDVTGDASVNFIGGSVNVGARCVVGDDPTAFSDLFVSGIVGGPVVGATFSVSELIVGRDGKGTMTVDNLGLAQIRSLEIGNDPNNSDRIGSIGNGTVTVKDGGTLVVSNEVTVGGSGTGLLAIAGGSLSPDGPGALMEVNQGGEVDVGNVGTANLSSVDVNPGGLFFVIGGVVNANHALIFGGEFRLLFSGDLLKISSGLIVSASGVLDSGSEGQVNIGEGSGANGKVRVGPNGILSGDGTIVAPVIETAGGDITQFTGGQIIPGNSPGTLTLQGDFTQEFGSSLVMEVAGLAAGEFDILHVTGDATLGGTLEMLFPGAYLPKAGDSFQILQVDGTISGDFAEVSFPQLLPGFQFDTMQVSGGFVFTALNDAVLAPTFLLNISTRLQVGTDDNVLIGGFILLGTEPKRVLIRAVGPSLEAAGVNGALADPTLELHDSTGALVGQNDNWQATQIGGVIAGEQFAQIHATGIPPTNNAESAIIATLDPGAYTAILAGANSSTGIGLVEVYDLGPANAPAKLANISTRGFVQTGDDVMIGGFIIGNQTSEVLVRGIGPSLTALGVKGALADPMLELHDVNGAVLASNDNWRSDQEAEIEATTIPPNDDLESAILRTLAPGAYTAILRGVSDASGVGLVEAYNLD